MKFIVNGIVFIVVLMLTGFVDAAGSGSEKSTIIIWEGTVQVKKTYTVPKGKTLDIKPGSRIMFSKGSGLLVNGTLKAIGQKDKQIVFTSAKKGTTGNWHEIMLDGAGDSVMEHCIIENASMGLHSHDTKLNLTSCTIRNSEVGLRFRSGPLSISKCRFTGNRIGLRSYRGIAQISESDFMDNEIGIFVREKGSGLNITRSNLFRNSAYNIRIGDFNDEDVKASDNWWGVDDPMLTIFDAHTEPGIGQVLYKPFHKEQINHNLVTSEDLLEKLVF
ncbi:MAG: right-handed parallel beta-helix repeat-containing protein [Desulfuromonadaceae bacterium]